MNNTKLSDYLKSLNNNLITDTVDLSLVKLYNDSCSLLGLKKTQDNKDRNTFIALFGVSISIVLLAIVFIFLRNQVTSNQIAKITLFITISFAFMIFGLLASYFLYKVLDIKLSFSRIKSKTNYLLFNYMNQQLEEKVFNFKWFKIIDQQKVYVVSYYNSTDIFYTRTNKGFYRFEFALKSKMDLTGINDLRLSYNRFIKNFDIVQNEQDGTVVLTFQMNRKSSNKNIIFSWIRRLFSYSFAFTVYDTLIGNESKNPNKIFEVVKQEVIQEKQSKKSDDETVKKLENSDNNQSADELNNDTNIDDTSKKNIEETTNDSIMTLQESDKALQKNERQNTTETPKKASILEKKEGIMTRKKGKINESREENK
jgi:hypothetical protein